MAQTAATTRKRSRAKNILLGLAAVLVLVVAGAATVLTVRCPCDTFPGLMLLGDVQPEPVRNWSFANDVPLCQIQVSAYGVPHAVNLNCFATPDGELYLSCSVCTRKFWAAHVAANEPAR